MNYLCESCYPVQISNPIILSVYSCTESPFSDLVLKGILDTIRTKSEIGKNIFFDSRCHSERSAAIFLAVVWDTKLALSEVERETGGSPSSPSPFSSAQGKLRRGI